jgi:CRP-like cAMP-binding protein
LALNAYQAGAAAVYPAFITAEILLQALPPPISNNTALTPSKINRQYQRGDIIRPDSDSVVEVAEGILALSVIHHDGAQVLLGLCGTGQLLITHPHDSCSLQLVAHTEAQVAFHPWGQAVQSPEFAERLHARLQHLEAWAAMQARPHLDQRILGLLSLLAEQFGEAHDEGTLINVRLTQAQLASAANATRPTITRAIGNLRKRGLLITVGSGDNERFCLREPERGQHLH